MKVIAIISATGIPSSRAISLSCDVACSFLPTSVCSKRKYWKATITMVTARMTRYWLSRNTDPIWTPPWITLSSRFGCAPKIASTEFCRKMDAPSVEMITGRNPRCRSG